MNNYFIEIVVTVKNDISGDPVEAVQAPITKKIYILSTPSQM